MRSEEEIHQLILNVAIARNEIRAVVLSGSRADKNIAKDSFQDYDVCFIVTELKSFTNNHAWVEVFGKRLIQQLPDEMVIGEKRNHSFAYLMLLKDGNRIDVTLMTYKAFQQHYNFMQPAVVLLDKDELLKHISFPTKSLPSSTPAQKEFSDCCNEFWWVSTYVVKGLKRNELIYAKQMLERPVRDMLLQMLQWLAGVESGFTAIKGFEGKYLNKQLPADVYEQLLETYTDGKAKSIWLALLKMIELFSSTAHKVSTQLHLIYNMEEDKNVRSYILEKYHLI